MQKDRKFVWTFSFTNMNLRIYSKKKCLTNISNPSCIDIFLTNNALSFQHIETVFTRLSDFHKLVLTVLKIAIPKNKPRESNTENIRGSSLWSLRLTEHWHKIIESCMKFNEIFLEKLNIHFLNLYKKERKKFLNGLNPSFITGNKVFCKIIKPSILISEVMEKVFDFLKKNKFCKLIIEFFKKAVSTLGIIENSFIINEEYKNIYNPFQRVILEFESHPRILPSKNKISNEANFKSEAGHWQWIQD